MRDNKANAPASASDLLRTAITTTHRGRIALVSSFGTESAVLLDMVAGIDQALPVIFLDTGKIFPDTIAYRDALITRLRLSNVRTIRPDPAHLASFDPNGTLFDRDPDLCCALRKTMPLDAALDGFDAWISGRKRAQAATRAAIGASETGPDGRVIFNPLHDWTRDDITRYFTTHRLPPHPLESEGFASLGCFTCTRRTQPGDHPRAGRWSGLGKTECGIFLDRAIAV
ncbi:MAG: phosphoadenylyl-sulfate reductase [Acidiphilium sp.]|nr:phosphoadenylyl-sulfate reductase [Acidiphilium sp.]MDD4936273.1 phosphoadenylyl-sulfate reductase [Acidiphilium sp.]